MKRLPKVLRGAGGKRLGDAGLGHWDKRLHGFAARPRAYSPDAFD